MSNLICEHCHKHESTVTVIEIPRSTDSAEPPVPAQISLCDMCAQAKNLPHEPVGKKSEVDIWKLLQASCANTPAKQGPSCPDCGMSLFELRSRGRVGCARDYELFADDILDILERMHGATEHRGRIPGQDPEEVSRLQAVSDLRRDLEVAIREEAYENAARIRDELKSLEDPSGSPQVG